MQIVGKRYDTGEVVAVTLSDSKIERLEAIPPDPTLPWLAPGFLDLQVNGFGGQEFNDWELTIEGVEKVSLAMDAQGVTNFCPTATTHSRELLERVMTTLASAYDSSSIVADRMLGIHLEGPYLSPEDGPRGAHPREHCRPPDWEEFQRLQEAAQGHLRILTMSPEYQGSPAFIRSAVDSGVVVAIGHTAANSEQIRAAVDAGATLSTHLGNGAHGQLRRHPNYIWDQLAEDRLCASLIADGHHLPPEVVKTFIRAKTVERCLLVSDITGMAGMPPGRYESTSLAGVEVLEDGRLVVAGQRQYLAGASQPLIVGVGNVISFAQLGLQEAINMATRHPARLVGVPAVELRPGQVADLIQFHWHQTTNQLELLRTVNKGKVVFDKQT